MHTSHGLASWYDSILVTRLCGALLKLRTIDVKGSKKTLVMREINEESVSSLLEKRDALADCDVAAFVYDG